MDWMLNFLSEVVLYSVGGMTVFVLSFGRLRAAPIKAEWSGELKDRGRLVYTHNGVKYLSTGGAQALGAVVLVLLALLVWQS